MATESCVTHGPAQFLYPHEMRNVWVIEKNANSFLELKLQPKQLEGGLPVETPPCREPNQGPDETASILPAIFDVKSYSTSSKTSFNILSEGPQDGKDACLKPGSEGLVKENTFGSNGMPPSLKSDDEFDAKKQEAPLKSKKSKKKGRKSRKKSKPSPETEQNNSHHPKSANGASNVRIRYTTEKGLSELGELTAQCKAVTIHQSNGSKTKINLENDVSVRRHTFQPYYTPHPPIASRYTNSYHKGDNSRRPSYTSPPSPVHLSQRSLSQAEKVYLQQTRKVYLSEKHSGVIRDEGREFPCAPPATPTPEHLKKFEYIPSLNDVRAQRAVREKLQAMEKRRQLQNEKRREDQARMDRIQHRDRQMELRRRQRQEIYALNQIMTELEHQRFMEFCQARGINS